MATKRQTAAAKKNVWNAAKAAKKKRSLANLPSSTKSSLGKQGAAVARRKRTGASTSKTRQELDNEARRRGLKAARR
jgi:hypothetical protein